MSRPSAADDALERWAAASLPAGAPVCGVDEVGRGPWAGPVTAAAAILDPARIPEGLDDSKRLTARARRRLAEALADCAEIGVGWASVAEIDALRIVGACDLAMRRAVEALPRRPAFLLVDGTRAPDFGVPARAIVRGDARSVSIAAASIVAKVARDAEMARLAEAFPGYGWETNMGYGAPAHAAGLRRLGVTPHHRRSFRPVAQHLVEAGLEAHSVTP
jgi:ribonuclease HII